MLLLDMVLLAVSFSVDGLVAGLRGFGKERKESYGYGK
jgi:hypothetical protein